jgi:hypothetical protein
VPVSGSCCGTESLRAFDARCAMIDVVELRSDFPVVTTQLRPLTPADTDDLVFYRLLEEVCWYVRADGRRRPRRPHPDEAFSGKLVRWARASLQSVMSLVDAREQRCSCRWHWSASSPS